LINRPRPSKSLSVFWSQPNIRVFRVVMFYFTLFFWLINPDYS
jgi:hypothetical protein